MARTKKYTPEETLRSLFNLQFIDSRIDSMREVRGELPMEVNDLEDEMAGLNKRLDKIEEETGDLNQLILEKKNIIDLLKQEKSCKQLWILKLKLVLLTCYIRMRVIRKVIKKILEQLKRWSFIQKMVLMKLVQQTKHL